MQFLLAFLIRKNKGERMIYLDNAATSFPKPRSVIKKVDECIKKYCGNPGRSGHFLSMKCAEEIYSTREKIATLLSFEKPENVVFCTNATYALNIAIKTLVPKGSHVLTSDIEHNSVLRPLETLSVKKQIEYSVFSTEGDISENIKKNIKPNTKAIVCSLTSNVTGKNIPLEILSNIKEQYGIILILDASQRIGHRQIDLSKYQFDAICAPGHKSLFGIQGCGFMVLSNGASKDTFIEGGNGANSKSLLMPEYLPERFEAGTLPTPSIISLGEGISFIKSYGIDQIAKKIDYLTDIYKERLVNLAKYKIYGSNGIISFFSDEVPSSIIANELSSQKICVRSGFHCAPLIHSSLGSEKFGTVRISLSVFNTVKEADILYKTLKEIQNKY